jgi:hypothetical protein
MPFKKKIDIEGLTRRITQHNTVQQIKKQELGLLPNIWANPNLGQFRQRFYALQGNETGLDQISREQIVRLSRELFFQLPGVGVASELKAEYVVGNHWEFKYIGKNETWGKQAEDFINNEWFNNCTTKGFAYDFQTVLKVLSRTIDMDGDVLMVMVRNKQNYPLLQFVGSHRVGSVGSNMTGQNGIKVNINGKDYACLDGIVYDDMDKPIAYSIKRDDAQIATVQQDPKVKNEDTIISIENAQLIFNPLVFDKGRGLPALYSSVLYGLQLQDLDAFLMDIAKLEATIAYVIKNDAGQAPQEYENLLNQIQAAGNQNGNLSNLPSIEPTVHGVSVVKGPTVNYIKSDGGDLQSFRSQRPSEEIQSYCKTIETKLLSAIGIPHQIIYSPETISGRAVNAVMQLVRKSVSERQKLIAKHAKMVIAWVLSVAMEEGLIPKNYDENLTKCIDFTLPPEFTLDQNQDNNSNIELYKIGLLSGKDYCLKNNSSFEDISKKRKEEIFELLTDVEEFKKKFPSMNESAILNLFTQRGQSSLKIEDIPTPAIQPKQNI